MATRMLQRRGTASQWTSANTVLAAGEIGVETDTGQFKIGDGTTAWSSIPYFKDTLDLDISGKAPINAPTFTGTVVLPSTTSVGNVSSTEIGYLDGVTSAIQTQLNAKAPTADPTFTGTVSGVTKTHVGLGNVDNTTDANKPVSSAQQTALNLKANIASPTFTGTVTLAQAPTADLQAATKLYVDNVAAGINFHEAVHAASINNLAVIYNNGTSGIGATLTADTNRAFSTLDSESVVVGQRVLIKDQTDQKQNGIYTLTTNGSGSVPWVLTRATDADNNPNGEMKTGDFTFVTNGTTNASFGFVNSSTANPIVIGTDNITYAQFNAAKTITAGNGLTEATPGILSIDTAITQARVANVTDTEIGYLDGVTSAIQTQLNTKAPTADPTFTGTVVLPSTTSIGNVSSTEIGHLDGVTSAIQTQLDAKAPTANPTFTGTLTVAASGIAFTDGTQIAEGIPSRTPIIQRTTSHTLSGIERDDLVEVSNSSATTVTIPTDSTFNFPIGTSIDILQTNTGQVTIAGAGGVTVNATPGLKLRTQWSSATLFKRAANTWLVFGDLTA
jgi:hypothetical protein